jgi:aminocarboxymuconate-semialdehyde decarboxylase
MHHAIREVGIERIVMGSDYCFGIGDDHPVATVNRFGASLPGTEREMILGVNASKLLKL